jgi:CheY-like chemotaxis protein
MTATAKKILVVDDDPNLTLLLRLNLEQGGHFHVREENNSTEALGVARDFKPDLILLDVMMPHLDGGDVLAQLLADDQLRDTPVIFLTAAALKHEVARRDGRIAGRPFLAKPVTAEVLIDCVQKNVAHR